MKWEIGSCVARDLAEARARAALLLLADTTNIPINNKTRHRGSPSPNDAVLVPDILLLIYFTFPPVSLRTKVRAAAVAHIDAAINRSRYRLGLEIPSQQTTGA